MKVFTKDIELKELKNGDFTVSMAINDSSLVIKTIKKKDIRKIYFLLKSIFDNEG